MSKATWNEIGSSAAGPSKNLKRRVGYDEEEEEGGVSSRMKRLKVGSDSDMAED